MVVVPYETVVFIVLSVIFFLIDFSFRAELSGFCLAQAQKPEWKSEGIGLALGFFESFGIFTLGRFVLWLLNVQWPFSEVVTVILGVSLGSALFLARRCFYETALAAIKSPGWKDDFPLILRSLIRAVAFYGSLELLSQMFA